MDWPGHRWIARPYWGLLVLGCTTVVEVVIFVVVPMAKGASVRLWLLAVALAGALTLIGLMHLVSEAVDLCGAMDSRGHESPPSV
jgi:hypothetical protein